VGAVRQRTRVGIWFATAVVLASSVARAHTYAASAFDAVTEGDDVYVAFRLDATSVIDMLQRGAPDGATIGKGDVEHSGAATLEYLASHFSFDDDGAPCPARLGESPRVDEQASKVTVAVVYACGRALDVLRLRSTLFEEETIPHQLVGSFRHKRAVENYLFSRGRNEAVIHVGKLAQVGPAEATRPGQFQMAAPPPGAFDRERAAQRARATGTTTGALATPTGTGFLAFLVEGIFHILGGFDHVLFVVALVSVVGSWSQLAKIVTSFTAAHSITLALGALELVRISPRLVEPLIAASILYVGLENVFRERPHARLGVTFGFGLVHGFGFSSVLRDLGLARAQLVPALVGFNLGVEIGQLLIVAPLAPLVWWLRRRGAAYRKFRIGTNACVALVAAWWFVQRVSGP
jgi:hydrogenase/urease accessory protein HupE